MRRRELIKQVFVRQSHTLDTKIGSKCGASVQPRSMSAHQVNCNHGRKIGSTHKMLTKCIPSEWTARAIIRKSTFMTLSIDQLHQYMGTASEHVAGVSRLTR